MQPSPGTPGTAIDVVVNDKGQSLLFREDGWGLRPPKTLTLVPGKDHAAVSDEAGFVGFVSVEAAAKLARGVGYWLGELANGSMVAVGKVRVEFSAT